MFKKILIYTLVIFKRMIRQGANLFLSFSTTPIVMSLFYLADAERFHESNLFLILFCMILQLFPIALFITQEVENLSILIPKSMGMSAWEIGTGIFFAHFINSCTSIIFAVSVSYLLGWGYIDRVQLLSNLSLGLIGIMGLGMFVGSMARNAIMSFLISSLLMFIMIVFSGLLIPLPNWFFLKIFPSVVSIQNLQDPNLNEEWVLVLGGLFYILLGYTALNKRILKTLEERI